MLPEAEVEYLYGVTAKERIWYGGISGTWKEIQETSLGIRKAYSCLLRGWVAQWAAICDTATSSWASPVLTPALAAQSLNY